MQLAQALDDVPYFEPPEKRVRLNFKVPASLRAKLEAVMRLWKIRAEANGRDPEDIDLTFVCARLLAVGVDGAWAEAGQLAGLSGMPSSEEEWKVLTRAIQKEAQASSKK